MQRLDSVSASCRYRSAVVCGVLLLGFAIIFLRLVYLQVIRSDAGAMRAERQHFKAEMTEAHRGGIFDRHGRMLAMNVEEQVVSVDTTAVVQPKAVASALAPILEMSESAVSETIDNAQGTVQFKQAINEESATALLAHELPGVGVELVPRRVYPKKELLSHVLGFAGKDRQGLEGVEWGFDAYLRGQKRLVHFQEDAHRHRIFLGGERGQRPQAGYRLTLTVDEVIQYIAEQELDAAMADTGAARGAVLIMDPHTGEMLAWVLRPGFDPNRYQHWPTDLRINRAVTHPNEPGSTLKIITAAAVLEEQLATPETPIYCGEGALPFGDTKIHDTKKYEWLPFRDVVAYSSNIGMAKAALSLGDKRLHRYLRKFGLDEKTGIDLPGESSGTVHPLGQWSARTLPSVAIGQEVSVTPIQLLTAVAAIANGGSLMRPYVVLSVTDDYGRAVLQREPEIRGRPISLETSEMLTEILETVVSKGTGTRAALPDYTVAGKTGTAQKWDTTLQRYSSTKEIGSFVGYVPAEDPAFVMLVMLDEPESKAWGGVVAAPVFQRIAQQALRHLQVVPRDQQLLKIAAREDGRSPSGGQ